MRIQSSPNSKYIDLAINTVPNSKTIKNLLLKNSKKKKSFLD